jgi:hypothetical protein
MRRADESYSGMRDAASGFDALERIARGMLLRFRGFGFGAMGAA